MGKAERPKGKRSEEKKEKQKKKFIAKIEARRAMEQESQGEESGQVDSNDVVDLLSNVDKPRVVVAEPGEVDSLAADISDKVLAGTMLSERTGTDEKDVPV
ncbi:hypothetical protein K503DRAFT_863500 [Rhizopogon vinicolor AM-OR11-026]|uniref:Uncharacterized protein n=1 Tax=Rhizopogon vinicolor AM-OR11-026 TaxID=1314800 RepID=A0A1B7NAM9_9AGAM|nr:hypothetical protein K503DRAFT_863500 [Rhizopogon vinicolor AM-OR11-026]